MLGTSLVVQAALLTLVGSVSILQYPFYYYQHPANTQQLSTVSGWKQINIRSDGANLPCPDEGFYVHPQNCSRFYRCVDYAQTGTLYSRFFFECPKNHIFLTAAQTCLPGLCTGFVQPVVAPPTTAAPAPTEAPAPVIPSVTPSETPVVFPGMQTEGPDPVEPETESLFPVVTDAPTIPPVEVSTDAAIPPTFPVDSPTESPATDFPPTEAPSCPDKYVQHPVYCNVYNPCNEPFVRYVCPTGTAFDQPRQMCRISAHDDGLCTNKEIFRHIFLMRSENIGTHVRLPPSIILPTQVRANQNTRPIQQSYVRPTASPYQLYLWPTPGGSQTPVRTSGSQTPVRTSGSQTPIRPSFNSIPASNFRPLLTRPAQTRPVALSASFNSALSDVQTVHNVAVPLSATKQRWPPLAVVRRPEGHLHFPAYNPLDFFGIQRNVEVA